MVIPLFLVIVLPLTIFSLFHNSSPICIFAKDHLYFFNSEILEFDATNSKKVKRSFTNGYVAYHEITNMEYIPPKRKILSSRLILKGNCFEITICDVGKWVMRNIKIRQNTRCNIKNTTTSDIAMHTVREGIWNELWESNQSGKIEKIFDEHTEVMQIVSDESCDTLDIIVCRNGIEICFNIDKDTIFMYLPSADVETTFSLNDFDDVKNIFAKLRELVVQNSNA